MWESVQKRLWRMRRNQNWLRIKALYRPNVVILSHHRSGYQWFRQICDANLPRHVVMPPGARYQHYNIERLPVPNKLDRNGVLLVRDGRDVMVSLFLSATVDGPGGTRRWRQRDGSVTFAEYLRSDAGAVRGPKYEVIARMTPVDYWVKFNTDWLANPNIMTVVRYEDLLSDQVSQIRKVQQALGYAAGTRAPIPINLDFDRHGPKGNNLPPGYQRRTEGNWRRIFSDEDLRFFVERAGDCLRALGYSVSLREGDAAKGSCACGESRRR